MSLEFEEESIIVPGIPVVVSGPSGVGKGSVVSAVLERHQEISHSISMTSRHPRRGEREGVDYLFVDRRTFLGHIEDGSLLEWAEVYEELYGTPKGPLLRNLEAGRDVIMEIDVQGGLNVRKNFPSACLIFVLPPSREELIARLHGRGTESAEEMKKRIAFVDHELTFLKHYDYLIVNRSIDRAAEQLRTIILAERCRRQHIEPVLRKAGILPDLDDDSPGIL
ncbi:MAG: guanylate kinase [bacterium]